MNRFVNTYNEIVGFHNYPDAPDFCEYLCARHRHVFVIRCSFKVVHNEREIEINKQQQLIEGYLHKYYGTPCEFGGMSCESIAEVIMADLGANDVQVLEDGYGGATLTL